MNHAALAALLAGHVLADFVFQSTALVKRKKRSVTGLVEHLAIVAICQGGTLMLFQSLEETSVATGIILVTHGLMDYLKIQLELHRPRPLLWWMLDQAVHLVVLLTLAGYMGVHGPLTIEGWSRPLAQQVMAMVALFGFLGIGASALVSEVLSLAKVRSVSDVHIKSSPRLGQLIGMLERWLVACALLTGAWSAVGLIIAAKSLARFKEFEDRNFAEYYLIGTLTSLLIVVVATRGMMQLLP